MGLLAGIGGVAHAEECARSYTSSELSRDLGSMTTAMRSKDASALLDTGKRMADQIGCVRKDLPPRVFASAYRSIGVYYYTAGEMDQASRWFRTALELEPSFEWGASDLSLDDPMRRAFDSHRSAATAEAVALAGKSISAPSGATLKLDGRALSEAAATTDRPHILMVVGEDRVARQVFVIDGNAIPDQFLSDREEAEEEAAPEDLYAAQKVERVRPPAKTPLMVAGGGLAIAGGAMWATTFATRAKFESSTTVSELDKYQKLTNTLVVASGVTFALGLGVEYVGIIISDQPGVSLGGRF
jgi:tetratricopeptide (TPR) repeat protein